MKLRPYQRRAVKALRSLFAEGTRKAVFVSPTGSGKSLVVTALAAACERDGLFDRVLVAVPMTHVQDSFANGRVRCGREVFDTSQLWAHVHGSGATKAVCAALSGSESFGTVVTHQALVGPSLACIEGADLSRSLLVIDEGHHTANGQDTNKLSRAREAWLESGGAVLVVSATPYRHDRALVVDDSWARVERSLIEHVTDSDGPYAPAKLECRTAVLEGFRPKTRAALSDSSKAGVSARRKFTDAIAKRWVRDWVYASPSHRSMGEGKRPKTIVIVPGFASQSWARQLRASFEQAGVQPSRLLDATGTTTEDQRRTRAALDAERSCNRWRDSAFDIVIACKRFDEASDWPLCSHVFVVGYPRSIPLTLQRWGRAFRNKAEIVGHPFKSSASITFFIPEWSSALREDSAGGVLSQYRDDAHLLACCLHDYTTGLEYATEGAAMRRRAGSKDAALTFNAIERAEAVRDIDRVRAKTKSLSAAVSSLCALPKRRAAAALAVLSERVAKRSPKDRALVQQAWDEIVAASKSSQAKPGAPKFDASLVRTSMLRVFRDALRETSRDTIPFDDEHLTLVADFTGQDVEALARALSHKRDDTRTFKRLEEEARAFELKHGRGPIPKKDEGWKNWEDWARRRGKSLNKLLIALGLRKAPASHSLSLSKIKKEIIAFGEATGYRPSGWHAHDAWLRAHAGSSLAKLGAELGYKSSRHLNPLRTLEKFQVELAAHFSAGLAPPRPHARDGKWHAWAMWLKRKGYAWRDFVPAPPSQTLASIEEEITEHMSIHGERPRVSRTANKWSRANYWLKHNHSITLRQLCDSLCKPRTPC